MVVFLLPHGERLGLEKAASDFQPDKLHFHKVQEVSECAEYDLHIADHRLLVRNDLIAMWVVWMTQWRGTVTI